MKEAFSNFTVGVRVEGKFKYVFQHNLKSILRLKRNHSYVTLIFESMFYT